MRGLVVVVGLGALAWGFDAGCSSGSPGGGGAGAPATDGAAGAAGDASAEEAGTASTCADAHGYYGCCAGDTLEYFDAASRSLAQVDCSAEGKVCGWRPDTGYYACVTGPANADPSGMIPIACGPPFVTADRCPGCSGPGGCDDTWATPVCDTASGSCVECMTSADCLAQAFGSYGSSKLLCNVSRHACVECLGDADCSADRFKGEPWRCTAEGRCVRCLSSDDCVGAATGSRCMPDSWPGCGCESDADCTNAKSGRVCSHKECGCSVDADCPAGRLCSGTTCFGPCTTTADCPQGWGCKLDEKRCVSCSSGEIDCSSRTPCASDADCTGDLGHVCLLDRGSECGCNSTADCPAGRLCGNSVCVPVCKSDDDCRTPYSDGPHCDVATGICQPCLSAADCLQHGLQACVPWPELFPGALRCARCATDADCALSPDGRVCRQGECHCDDEGDCTPGATCMGGGWCAFDHCRVDADCLPVMGLCDTSHGWCWDGA